MHFTLLSLTAWQVLSVHLHTAGNRAFSVAAPKIWNSFPSYSSVLLTYLVGTHVTLLSLTAWQVLSVHLHNRAFPVAAPKIWNSFPDDIVSSTFLSTFCRLLKTFLFNVSFTDLIL